MHMLSRKDLHSAELDTVKESRKPTTVITANREVQTKEEATVYVNDRDLFVTQQILEDTPQSYRLENSAKITHISHESSSSQKPHIKNDRKSNAKLKTMYRSLSQDY